MSIVDQKHNFNNNNISNMKSCALCKERSDLLGGKVKNIVRWF